MFSGTVMAMLVNGLGSLRFFVVPGSGGDAGIIVVRVASFNLLLSVDWDQEIDRILAPRAAWLHGFRILLCLGMCSWLACRTV